jgi:hypothetical protein
MSTTLTDLGQVAERAKRLVSLNLALAVTPAGQDAGTSGGHWWTRDPETLSALMQDVDRSGSDPCHAGWQLNDLLLDITGEDCESPIHWLLAPPRKGDIDGRP